MSLHPRRSRIDVSTSDDELDSVVSSDGYVTPDSLVEELARMSLAGRYYGAPRAYETSEMLKGRGMARRPRPSDTIPYDADAGSYTASRRRGGFRDDGPYTPSAGASPAFFHRTWSNNHVLTSSPAPVPPSPSGHPMLHRAGRVLLGSRGKRELTARELEAAEMADVETALDRMYRRLALEFKSEMRAADLRGESSEGGSAAGANSSSHQTSRSPSAASRASRKQRSVSRKRSPKPPDQAALARLLVLNDVQKMRRVEKYHKVRDREEEARKHPKRVRVPQKSVALGRRLHLEDQVKRNNRKSLLDEQNRVRRAAEKKSCTFHPTITSYAERVGGRADRQTLEEEIAAQVEERQRQKLERVVELERECTFHPVLSTGSEALMAQRRRQQRQHQQRHSSRAHSRRRSPSRERNAGSPPPSHEPFESAERLYRDGAERMLRQQVRQRRAVHQQERLLIGGQVRLTADAMRDMTNRFEAWTASKKIHHAELKDELLRVVRQPGEGLDGAVGGSSPLRRRSSSTAAPVRNAMAQTSTHTARPDEKGSGSALVAQPSAAAQKAASKPSTPPLEEHQPLQRRLKSSAPAVASRASPPLSSEGSGSLLGGSTADRAVASPTAALRIRLGALFYKFTATASATSVSLEGVEERVRLCYPEDATVVTAIAAAVVTPHDRLSKADFMAALAAYVTQYGLQPWCMPTSRSSTGGASTVHGRSERARAVAEDATEEVGHAPGLVRSAASSVATSTPAQSDALLERQASVPASQLSRSPSRSSVPPKPLRTHIYHLQRDGEEGENQRQKSEPPSSNDGGPSRAGDVIQSAKQRKMNGQQRRSSTPRRPTDTGNHSHTKLPAAQLVHGYEHHVERQRRSSAQVKRHPSPSSLRGEQGGGSAAGLGRDEEECTFHPKLNRRSVVLSEQERGKRASYAKELQERREELEIRRASVLRAAISATTGDVEVSVGTSTESQRSFGAMQRKPKTFLVLAESNPSIRPSSPSAGATPVEPVTPAAPVAAANTARSSNSVSSLLSVSHSCDVSSLSSANTPAGRAGSMASSTMLSTLSTVHPLHSVVARNRAVAEAEDPLSQISPKKKKERVNDGEDLEETPIFPSDADAAAAASNSESAFFLQAVMVAATATGIFSQVPSPLVGEKGNAPSPAVALSASPISQRRPSQFHITKPEKDILSLN